jgi:regulatory protein
VPRPFMFKIDLEYMENQKTITAISAIRHPGREISDIFLDGVFAFCVANEIVARKSLKVGQVLSQQDIINLNEAEVYHKCLNAALHFLSYRPRSESEITSRLEQHGYDGDNITRVLAHLKSLNLVNDSAFASYWKDNRNAFQPRSQSMVKIELRRKGLEAEIIDQVVQDVDDEENAYRIALNKAQKLPPADFQVFRQKLGGFLQRRGFSYGIINKTIKRVWQEQEQGITPESET